MSKHDDVLSSTGDALVLLETGVHGLDELLGGGLPELSFNLIAGSPGTGKTTLAMQILFANASVERPGLFVTLLGEPSLKMLRYQRRFGFFDTGSVGTAVHFLNLTEEALRDPLTEVLKRITEEVDAIRPGFVVIDSFRSLVRSQHSDGRDNELEQFVQQLALLLTTSDITSFLIGEYEANELRNPVFTVADGIFWLSQEVNRNSVVRKLQVVKARGIEPMPGLHTLRMSRDGIQVFPRIPQRGGMMPPRVNGRLSTGVPGLDDLMGGGIPIGDSLVLAGPTGTGKTTFAMAFVAAGLRRGESAVIAIFEERPEAYLERALNFDVDLAEAIKANRLRIIYIRPLDLSVDETLEEIRLAVTEIGASRVVIDSISGFEMALAPTFREDFRESLYRLIGALTSTGVTIFSTVEVVDTEGGLQLTGYQVSFLTDDIISQRYVEIEGRLRKALVIVKMRGSVHSPDFRIYEITTHGIKLREALPDFDGITSGMPTRQTRAARPTYPGLTDDEVQVLEFVIRNESCSVADLSAQSGLSAQDLEIVLTRLVHLHHVRMSGTQLTAIARP